MGEDKREAFWGKKGGPEIAIQFIKGRRRSGAGDRPAGEQIEDPLVDWCFAIKRGSGWEGVGQEEGKRQEGPGW